MFVRIRSFLHTSYTIAAIQHLRKYYVYPGILLTSSENWLRVPLSYVCIIADFHFPGYVLCDKKAYNIRKIFVTENRYGGDQ